MANRITSIEFVNSLGPSPAMTHRPSGKIWVSENFLGRRLRKRYWDYIIDHEEGHIVLNTKSEFEADAYASTKFFNKYPNEPFDSVEALKAVLPMDTAEQHERVKKQQERAEKFAATNNFSGTSKTSNMFQSPKTFFSLRQSWNCKTNPNAPGCKEPGTLSWNCLKNPNAIGCKEPGTLSWNCIKNPNAPGCKEPGTLKFKIDGWGGLSPEVPGKPLWREPAVSLNPGPSIDLRAPSIGPNVGWSNFSPSFDPGFSAFTNCNKYLLGSRRRKCEDENQRERQVQLDLQEQADATKIAIAKMEIDAKTGLAQILGQTVGGPPSVTGASLGSAPAVGGSKTGTIVMVLVAGAALIGLVLYFTKKKAVAA